MTKTMSMAMMPMLYIMTMIMTMVIPMQIVMHDDQSYNVYDDADNGTSCDMPMR